MTSDVARNKWNELERTKNNLNWSLSELNWWFRSFCSKKRSEFWPWQMLQLWPLLQLRASRWSVRAVKAGLALHLIMLVYIDSIICGLCRYHWTPRNTSNGFPPSYVAFLWQVVGYLLLEHHLSCLLACELWSDYFYFFCWALWNP